MDSLGSDLSLSEKVVVFVTLNLVIIWSKWLPDIVWIECILRGALFLSASVSLSQDLTTGHVILFEHFNSENVIDLNIMGRDTIVKEVGWEHHVVTSIPELRLILLIEGKYIAMSNETESSEDN